MYGPIDYGDRIEYRLPSGLPTIVLWKPFKKGNVLHSARISWGPGDDFMQTELYEFKNTLETVMATANQLNKVFINLHERPVHD